MNKFLSVLLGKKAIAHLAILQYFLMFFPPRKLVNIWKDALHGPTKNVNLAIISYITFILQRKHVNIWKDVLTKRIINALFVIIINFTDLPQSKPVFT